MSIWLNISHIFSSRAPDYTGASTVRILRERKHSQPQMATFPQCCHPEAISGLLETGFESGCLKTFNWKLGNLKEVPIVRAYRMDAGIKSRESQGELVHYLFV